MLFVFITHPDFLESQSMPRFSKMLSEGMISRGYQVEILTPKPLFFKLPVPKSINKWTGYIDQYLVFPSQFRRYLKNRSSDTLYIFTDNALGPWVPLVANRPHVVHCHDFLAQQSALNEIPQNKTSWTGRRYQAFIRRGYSKAKNFISVSNKTRNDLHAFLGYTPKISEVVYNGLNQSFGTLNVDEARASLKQLAGIDLSNGYILHVGGNQWYKNRAGVIAIYNAWRDKSDLKIPLLMLGLPPSSVLRDMYSASSYKEDIYFLSGINDDLIRKAYAGALVMLFPSIAEGFGWPIAEAMASGCPVITTNEAPMTEVAGDAAYLIPVEPRGNSQIIEWANEAAQVLDKAISLSPTERKEVVDKGLINAKRFNTKEALDGIEKIYLKIINRFEEKS